MLTTSIKYDVMLNERFYATLTSVIPYKLYENEVGGVKLEKKLTLVTLRRTLSKDCRL